MTTATTTMDSGRGRLRRLGLRRHSLVLAWRSLAKTSRNPGAVINGVMTPAIFLVLSLYLFGGSVAGSTRDYLQYLFPGILVMGAGLAGMLSTGVGITIDMKKGVFDRFRSLPIGRAAPLLGSLLADLVRYTAAVAILFGIGYLLGFRVQTGLPSALAAAALAITFGFCLSWSTVLLAALAKDESAVLAFSFIAFLPLQLGTSLAAPTDTLPGPTGRSDIQQKAVSRHSDSPVTWPSWLAASRYTMGVADEPPDTTPCGATARMAPQHLWP